MTEGSNKDNIDVSSGNKYPINAEEQGKIFEEITPFMISIRKRQLIKRVNYRIEVEYYSEDKN